MDKLILGIVGSKQPFQVKEAFLDKISTAARSGDKDACYSVLKACLIILYPVDKSDDDLKDSLVCDRVERLLLSWVESNLEFSIVFTEDFILTIKLGEMEGLWMKCRHIRMLQHQLKVLRGVTIDGYVEFKNNVKEYLINEIFQVDNMVLLFPFSEVFLQNSELISTKINFNIHIQLIQLIVKIVAKSTSANSSKMEDEEANIHCIESVSELFKNCIDMDINVMKYAAGLVFKEIANHTNKPCANLASFLVHLKCDILRESLESSLLTVPDLSVASILIQLLDWFYVCEIKINIDSWIMIMIEFLTTHEKFNILIPVVIAKVSQICELIYNPFYRKQAVTVLAFMLMSCNKNPNPFHTILVDFPTLMIHLKHEGSKSATQAHHTLAELIFTLMYNFPGFNKLYAPLITVLEGHEKPSVHVMKMWLSNFGTSQDDNVSIITMEHMHPVETGLKNLGNTCYMNSIIQALFNLVIMKRKILTTTYKGIMQPILMNLQNVFAFLHLSKRSSIEPKGFFGVSRPSWFQPGSQQDCSEYLKHLLDKLQQESNDEIDKIDDLFNGEINATVECLHCHSCSHQKEVFNDLPLSFKDNHYDNDILHGSSLKGGDSSDILDSKKVNFELGENSKDNVKTSLETDTNMADSDNMFLLNSHISIIDLVNSYFLPELLKDTNQYFCDVCVTLRDAYKSMKIAKFPKYLILTLKRFTYNIFTKKRSKILDIIKYPLNFSICNGCDSCYQALGTTENTVLAFTSETDCQLSKKYRISSVIVHSGLTSDSGHYYCYSCHYTNEKCSWYLLNDEEVKLVSDNCILNLASNFSRDTPYVCIYEECEPDVSVQLDLPGYLTEMVETDNQLYLQEKIMKSKQKSPQTLVLNSSLKNDKKDNGDNDDDSNGSIGPCGSGGGNDWGGARFVC